MNTRTAVAIVNFALLTAVAGTAGAQLPDAVGTGAAPATQAEALRIYLECFQCQSDYVRREITFVNYVRDRQDAQVHVMVTSQTTGGAGRVFTLYFLGSEGFVGVADTLEFAAPANATDDYVRTGLTDRLKLGLMQFVAGTPQADGIRISYSQPASTNGDAATTALRDPWNFWTFRVGLNGNAGGESSRSNWSTSGSLTGNRTTETWKASFGIDARHNENSVTLTEDDVERVERTIRRNWGMDGTLVRSVGYNMAVGFTGGVSSAVFSNYDLSVRIAPAFEYSFFPYAESSRRRLIFQYSVGAQYADYAEETIYFQTEETLVNQNLNLSYYANQPWGSGRISAERTNYMHDFTLNRMRFDTNLDLNLVRGLTFSLGGSYASIHDQVSLRRRSPSDEDVLLSRQQLETNYDYSVRFGLGYRFGSIYNNVVNPRLAGGGF